MLKVSIYIAKVEWLACEKAACKFAIALSTDMVGLNIVVKLAG